MEVRAEGIAAPRHTGNADAGFAEEGIVDGDRKRSLRRKLLHHGVTDDGEEGRGWQTMTGEETIIGGPVVKLLSTSSQQAGDGVTAKAEQAAQREGLSAFGDAPLGEGREAVSPELLEGGEDAGRVFFKREAGGWRRRRASRLLSSMDHSTVSPREKSKAWATAEGKLIYHCSLALRLMSWTLVGKPMAFI